MLAESAIDTLSHATLFPAPSTRYAPIGREMNPRHPDLLLGRNSAFGLRIHTGQLVAGSASFTCPIGAGCKAKTSNHKTRPFLPPPPTRSQAFKINRIPTIRNALNSYFAHSPTPEILTPSCKVKTAKATTP